MENMTTKDLMTKESAEEKAATGIKVFENPEFGRVRAVEINGEPWFVGKDVAEILGYSESAKAIRIHVDKEDKGVSKMDTPGGRQNITIINESGLYSLILSSKLPTAKRFKRWVTSDILPTIRRTGGYITQGNEIDFLNNPNSPLYSYIKSLDANIEMLQKQLLSITACEVNTKALNIWKKSIAKPLIDEIADKYDVDARNAYDLTYDVMSANYGFSRAVAIIQFCEKHHCKEVSTINAIADNPIYQEQFVRGANELIASAKGCVQKKNVTEFTVNDDFDFIVTTLAERLNDRSRNHSCTYGKIYNAMNSKQGWKNLMTRNHTKNKKNIILADKKKFAKFVAACNCLIKEVS